MRLTEAYCDAVSGPNSSVNVFFSATTAPVMVPLDALRPVPSLHSSSSLRLSPVSCLHTASGRAVPLTFIDTLATSLLLTRAAGFCPSPWSAG